MAPRGFAGRRARTGPGVPAIGAPAARLAAGGAAVALAAGLAVYACLGLSPEGVRLAATLAGLGVAAIAVEAAGWWPGAAIAGQAALGLVYVAVLVATNREVDPGAPAVAAGLLLAGELAVLARDSSSLRSPALLPRRLLALGLVALGAVAAGWLLLAAAALELPGGPATTLAGVLAATAAVAVVAVAVRDRRA